MWGRAAHVVLGKGVAGRQGQQGFDESLGKAASSGVKGRKAILSERICIVTEDAGARLGEARRLRGKTSTLFFAAGPPMVIGMIASTSALLPAPAALWRASEPSWFARRGTGGIA